MGKTRTIAKSCPKCSQQVAVATKNCKCGHSFFIARRANREPSPEVEVNEERRRTRPVRAKPDFYDSQEFDKNKKKRARKPKTFYNEDKLAKIEETDIPVEKKQKREPEVDEDSDIFETMSEEQKKVAALILAEINRKVGGVSWRPT